MQNTDAFIIDIQFVVGNEKEYYIKELAVLDLETSSIYHQIFKPKFVYSQLSIEAKRQDYFNYKNINGLRWSDGCLDYGEISNWLNMFTGKNIIVRGIDKKRVLQKYLPKTNIIDLEMSKSLYSCKDPGICCYIHKRRLDLRCATKTVLKIKQYIIDCNIKI